MVRKMPLSKPDAVVLDLEDSVPPDAKDAARSSALQLAAELASGHPTLPVLLRVNSPDSPWFGQDLTAARSLETLWAVVVPKVEDPRQLETLGLRTVAGIETARAVFEVRNLVAPPVVAVYFGAEDYVTDLGGRRTVAGLEVLHARSEVALTAHVAGVQALDQVVLDFHDDDRFRTEAAAAVDLGYSGKLCIHPRQVPLANEAFTPSADEVARSRFLLTASEELAADGHGVFVFDGKMVDEPMLRRARSILDRVGY